MNLQILFEEQTKLLNKINLRKKDTFMKRLIGILNQLEY